MGRRRRSSIVASAAVIMLAAAGCSGGTSSPTGHASDSTQTGQGQTGQGQTGTSSTAADPLARAEPGLRAALAAYYRAYQSAVASPGDASAVNRLLAVYGAGSPGAVDMSARMIALAKKGYSSRPGPNGYYVVLGVDVSPAAGGAEGDGATAQVTACLYYDGVTYNTKRKGSDGKPLTVGASTDSGRTRFRYVRQGGAWKLVGGDVLETWTGANHCPARS